MPLTLHVDLLNTDLEDFASHFRGLVRHSHFVLPDVLGSIISTVAEDDCEDRWNALDWPDDNVPQPVKTYVGSNDYDEAKESLQNTRFGPMFSASIGYVKTTILRRRASITFCTALLATKSGDPEEIIVYSPPTIYTSLFAAQYQRSRLKLTLDESDSRGPCAKQLLEWLRPRWGTMVLELLLADAPPAPAVSELDILTPQQQEIARLLAQDMTDAQIAEALTISPETVKSHRKNIAARWGITQHAKPLRIEAKRRLAPE